MNALAGLAYYDPWRLGEPAFLAGFVARGDLAKFLLDILRSTKADEMGAHQNIVGQRGMGKTSLLRRVAIGISADADLSARYVPLTFREEQYNVRSLDRFWRNCGEALAEWAEALGNERLANEIDERMERLEWRNPQQAGKALTSETSAVGLRPVLLVDNFDLILDALPEEEHWMLRKTLQERGGPILICASVKYLEDTADREGAFYEFFRIHYLDPLSADELLECMRRLADARGDQGEPVREVLDREPSRIRTVHTLSGGNPRVLALLYQLLERSGTESAFADLEDLLDQLTPFYKARVEDYTSDQQRAIIDAIALNWDPITSAEIARETGILQTTISSQLARLRNEGLIEEVETSGTRSGYQLAERFFNIWYLMRHGTRRIRQRMKWLTAFLQSFYGLDELRKIRQAAGGDGRNAPWRSFYCEAIEAALETLEQERRDSLANLPMAGNEWQSLKGKSEDEIRSLLAAAPENALAWARLADHLARRGAIGEAIEATEKALAANSANNAIPLAVGASVFAKAGDLKKGESLLGKALELYPAEIALRNAMGIFLTLVPGREEEAEKYLQEGVAAQSSNAALWRVLGVMLAKNDARSAEAEDALRRALEIDPTHESASLSLVRMLRKLGRSDEARDELERATTVNPEADGAWQELGFEASGREDFGAALAAFRKVAALKPDTPAAATLVGLCLMALGRIGEAEQALHAVVEGHPNFGLAWGGLGTILASDSNRSDEAIAALKRAIDCGAASALDAHSLIKVLADKGPAGLAEAEQVLRQALEREPNHANLNAALGDLLADRLCRFDEAEALYRKAVDAPGADRQVLLSNLAWLLLALGRLDEARAIRETLANLPSSTLSLLDAGMAVLRDNFGTATDHLGSALQDGLVDEQIDSFDDLLRLMRLMRARGYAEQLLGWLKENKFSDQYAPVFAAFKAYVGKERQLLDVNPEVREAARKIYDWLASADRDHKPRKRAGRPRKRR